MFPHKIPLRMSPTRFDRPDSTLWNRAYDACRRKEAEARKDAKLVIYSRVLGYMLIEAPSAPGRTFIAREIKTAWK